MNRGGVCPTQAVLCFPNAGLHTSRGAKQVFTQAPDSLYILLPLLNRPRPVIWYSPCPMKHVQKISLHSIHTYPTPQPERI